MTQPIVSRKEATGTRYFTGKPCKHGHISERLVSTGACIQCEREREKKRYAVAKAEAEAQRPIPVHTALPKLPPLPHAQRISLSRTLSVPVGRPGGQQAPRKTILIDIAPRPRRK